MANFTIVKTLSPAVDLSTFSGSSDPSSTADFVQFFARANFRPTSKLRIILQSTSGSNDRAEYVLDGRTASQSFIQFGLGSLLEVQQSAERLLERELFTDVTAKEGLARKIAEKTWISVTLDWQEFLIPKIAFTRRGNFDWATSSTINKVTFLFENVGGGEACISDVQLSGGGLAGGTGHGGMQGNYKYRITFFNSVTGNRSNPGAAIQTVENVKRGYVTLSNLPTSADPQVTDVEIWRTLGDGVRFFKVGSVSNGTATFTDEVADHDALDDIQGAEILSSLELPTDNDVPFATFDHCLIDALQSFWIDNTPGRQGRVYNSPSGRPESLEGFINVTEAGDPLHRLVLYRGQRFVFSESRVYRLDSTSTGLLIPREVSGVPGVQFAQRRTVKATPRGIMYQATDGVRIFDGSNSQLAAFDAVGKLFRGEAAENLTAFEGIEATFARGEYIISDGTQTLALNVQDLSWRDTGFATISALFYEWDTDKIQAGRTAQVELIEEEGVFADAGPTNISFEWETPALDFPNDKVLFVERIYSDANTQSITVTPTLVHLDGTITLDTLTASGRQAVLTDVQRLVRKPSVRYTGSGQSQVTLFDCELEFRELVLGVRFPDGERITVEGRTTQIDQEINFIVDPPDRRLTGENFIPLIQRLQLDINTGGNDIDPVILTAEGTEIFGNSVNTTSRQTVDVSINQISSVRGVRLEGDFTADVQLFGLELTVRNIPLSLVIL